MHNPNVECFASRIKKSFKKKKKTITTTYPHKKKIKKQRSYLAFNDPLALPWRINGRSSILPCWRGASVMARGETGATSGQTLLSNEQTCRGCSLYRDSLDTVGTVARPLSSLRGKDRFSWFFDFESWISPFFSRAWFLEFEEQGVVNSKNYSFFFLWKN